MKTADKEKQSVLALLWHDSEAEGYTDLLPTEWFARIGHAKGRTHQVRGPRKGFREAKCDVKISSTDAQLNYEPYQRFNEQQRVDIGVLRIQFASNSRKDVTFVSWRDVDAGSFNPCSITVKVESTLTVSDSAFDELLLIEGNPTLRSHFVRERKPELVRAKKRAVLSATGRLACEACTFCFSDMFGDLGENFCEVHHKESLASSGARKVGIADLAVLCSNCHQMIHRTGSKMWTVARLASYLRKRSKRDELRRRKQRYLQHPVSRRTWEQVKQRARSQHG